MSDSHIMDWVLTYGEEFDQKERDLAIQGMESIESFYKSKIESLEASNKELREELLKYESFYLSCLRVSKSDVEAAMPENAEFHLKKFDPNRPTKIEGCPSFDLKVLPDISKIESCTNFIDEQDR